jgi:hypothetical protein
MPTDAGNIGSASTARFNSIPDGVEIRMHNPRPWNTMPPPSNATGHVEARFIDDAGVEQTVRIRLFHYTEGRSVWGHCIETHQNHDRQVTVHPDYNGWRYVGPTIPSADMSAIVVWKWHDAPGELRAVSEHGGDEDWVALLPDEDTPSWMDSGGSFAICHLQIAPLGDGRFVAIGAHA